MTQKELDKLLNSKPKNKLRVFKKLLNSLGGLKVFACYGAKSFASADDFRLSREEDVLELYTDIMTG